MEYYYATKGNNAEMNFRIIRLSERPRKKKKKTTFFKIPFIWHSRKDKPKVKEESENVGLKLNIQKTKIMATGPITSLQIDGETMETVADFIFLGSKITADGDCSHEIKRRLLLGKKSYDQPRLHIKKQRHYFANKGPSNQSYAFSSSPVWMWELDYKEGWKWKWSSSVVSDSLRPRAL